jgi:hypothetical protein
MPLCRQALPSNGASPPSSAEVAAMVSNVTVCLVRTQRVGEFHKLKQGLVMKHAQYVPVKTFAQFSLSCSLPFILP